MSRPAPEDDPTPTASGADLFRHHRTVSRELLGRIPHGARHVVDVGCAGGALGRILKTFDPAMRVVGIEVNPAAADEARRHLDHVVTGDVEAVDPAQITEAGTVDCIVYGNILERLRDPWGLVRRHVPLLGPDGLMVASIVNVEHFRVLRDLIAGQWGYRRSGTMDIAHLRFFNRDGIVEMFRQAGLTILSSVARVPPDRKEEHGRFVEAVEPALRALGIDSAAFSRRTAAEEHTVVAARAPRSTILVQAITRNPAGGFTDIRIAEPLAFMGSEADVVTAAEPHQTNMAWKPSIRDRILVWQRPFLNVKRDAWKVERLIRRGYLIVLEIDDNPYHRKTSYAVDDYFTFRAVHAVQTSTRPLETVLASLNPTCRVFQNQIARLPPFPDLERRAGVRLFFGAFNRGDDWAPLMPALNGLLARHPDVAVDVVHDEGFFNAVETRSKTFRAVADYAAYKALLGQADIALLPLADTPFNRTKSDLKFIESAACGAVALASPVVYRETLVDGETGLLFDDASSFVERLERLIAEPDLRYRLAREAYRYVATRRMLARHYPERVAWYRSLLARRTELTEALFRRAPEVAPR